MLDACPGLRAAVPSRGATCAGLDGTPHRAYIRVCMDVHVHARTHARTHPRTHARPPHSPHTCMRAHIHTHLHIYASRCAGRDGIVGRGCARQSCPVPCSLPVSPPRRAHLAARYLRACTHHVCMHAHAYIYTGVHVRAVVGFPPAHFHTQSGLWESLPLPTPPAPIKATSPSNQSSQVPVNLVCSTPPPRCPLTASQLHSLALTQALVLWPSPCNPDPSPATLAL